MQSQTNPEELCEWPRCEQKALCEVHAQWTIFDFVMYLSCREHYQPWLQHLNGRLVDGQFPLELWSNWFAVE